ncbi:MAG: replicative DNA helicase [Prevotellaceae bacterium]|jgi:replicative DNA helicase|nr:replicative DNA helicase [Prevotellaceae bacterium]
MAIKNNNIQKKNTANIHLTGLELGKKPPQAIDLEEAVLGAVMVEKDTIINVQELLKPESFYKEAHQKIYRAIQELSASHEPIDIYTVSELLKKKDELDEIGGPYYLSQLTLKVGSAAHVEYHAKVIVQKYIQRELIRLSSEIQRDAFDDKDVDELLDEAQQGIFDLAEGNIRTETKHISDVVANAIKDIETAQNRADGLSGIASGFSNLDSITLGWQPSDLVVVAARPSMGKTAFVLSMARNMAVDHKIPVAFFSLEMSSMQLVKRLLVSETGISSEKIRGGKKLDPHEWTQLEKKISGLVESPLYIDDTPALSIYEFRAKARRLMLSHHIQAIVIDYLQLMTGPPNTMREQEISAISRSLKAIAKELNVPIIALSQLNRAVETRGGNKRPQLSDIRESGAIEQDADLVLFIHRPEYYGMTEDESGNSLHGIAELIIAKHRNGATADVRLRWISEQAKFTDDTAITQDQGNDAVIHQSKMNQIPHNKNFDIPSQEKAPF